MVRAISGLKNETWGTRLGKEVWFRADAAFAKPEIHQALEERVAKYMIGIPVNDRLLRNIAELLIRPVGRPGHKP